MSTRMDMLLVVLFYLAFFGVCLAVAAGVADWLGRNDGEAEEDTEAFSDWYVENYSEPRP